MVKIKDVAEELAEDARNYWIVRPEAGYVVKTSARNNGPQANSSKLFVNICHCSQIPPPMEGNWDENDMLRKLETNPDDINVPTCVGTLELTKDLKNETARKVDVVINSTFYKKHVDGSEFYRQLLFMVVCSAIERQHDIIIDVKNHKTLRKNQKWGEINEQRIRKSPAECLIKEDKSACIDAEDYDPTPALDTSKFTVRLIAGRMIELELQAEDEQKLPVVDDKRLRCRLNSDRIVVLLDNKRTLLDIFLPIKIIPSETHVEFDGKSSKLFIRSPVKW